MWSLKTSFKPLVSFVAGRPTTFAATTTTTRRVLLSASASASASASWFPPTTSSSPAGTVQFSVNGRRHIASMARKRLPNPALFVCDVQDKFRSAIYEFPKVISTTKKLTKAAKILSIPIYVTTQNASRLGDTVEEVASLLPPSTPVYDKTAFSMMVPELLQKLTAQANQGTSGPQQAVDVILVGIESHICVTQTALDLLSLGHKVYILADGVSSCNAGERPVALARLAKEGATVTSSESILFELLGDAGNEHFKAVSGLVKETKDDTKAAVDTFCKL